MPRKPRVIETGDEGTDGQPVQAPTKPEGISDEQWAIGGALGNLALATALLDVTGGKRAPHDDRETAALMDAARKLEARSYRRYRTLKDGIGKKLEEARADNLEHAKMVERIRDLEVYGADVLVSRHGQNGNRGPLSTITNEPITGEVGGTVGGYVNEGTDDGREWPDGTVD